MRERVIERALFRGVAKLGGYCYKWISPGANGVPDRLVVLPGGRILFVETKAPNGVVDELQRYQLQKLQGLGAEVRIVASQEDVMTLLAELRGD